MYLNNSLRRRKRGATMVESAIVLGVTFLLLLGLIVGGLGVVRYQTVAGLAREATRVASVRGGQYRQDHGLPAGDPSTWSADIYSNGQARFPSRATLVDVSTLGLDPGQLTYTCSWSTGANGQPDNFATYTTTDNNGNVVTTGNWVQVTVSYQWFPEALFVGPITLSSTSQIQITY
jgi:Flp pilus assembly protein TadG